MPGLIRILNAKRDRFSASGSTARMRAFRPARAATKNENSPTLAPISTKTKRDPPALARSISAESSARFAQHLGAFAGEEAVRVFQQREWAERARRHNRPDLA